MKARFGLSHEVARDCHLIAFGDILLQNTIVLDACGNSVITAGNNLVAILELNVHGDDLLNVDNQLAAFLCHEIAGSGHLVAFGDILLQNTIVLDLDVCGNGVVATGDNFVTILELDVHGDSFDRIRIREADTLSSRFFAARRKRCGRHNGCAHCQGTNGADNALRFVFHLVSPLNCCGYPKRGNLNIGRRRPPVYPIPFPWRGWHIPRFGSRVQTQL